MTQYMHPSTLEFLNAARGDDEDRPSLQKIAVHHSFLLAADGFRLHAVRFSAEADPKLRDKTDLEPDTTCDIYLVPSKTSDQDESLEIVATNKESRSAGNNTLLDLVRTKAVLPPENPKGRIALNRQFLIDALVSMPDDIERVVLEIPEDKNTAMCIYGGGGYFAVIMPAYIGGLSDEIWRPL